MCVSLGKEGILSREKDNLLIPGIEIFVWIFTYVIINNKLTKEVSNGCKGFQVRNLTKRYPAFSLSSLPSQHLISYILILLIMVNHPCVKLFPLSKSGPWYYNWTRQWKKAKKLKLKRDLSFYTIAYIHMSFDISNVE